MVNALGDTLSSQKGNKLQMDSEFDILYNVNRWMCCTVLSGCVVHAAENPQEYNLLTSENCQTQQFLTKQSDSAMARIQLS